MYKDEILEVEELLNYQSVKMEVKGKNLNAELNKVIHFALQHAEERPAKKPVDLSVLIESGIDCEFSNTPGFEIKRVGLVTIQHGMHYGCNARSKMYSFCRPRMNHIHYWPGGHCPLPEGVRVRIYLRFGEMAEREASVVAWEHLPDLPDEDIIGFEVLGLDDNHCWPWDADQ